MKLANEFSSGVLIFLGIGIYFVIIEVLGLSDVFFLRIFNAAIVMYGVNRTVHANILEHKRDYHENFISGFITAMIGVVLSIIALRAYATFMGGEAFVRKLGDVLWFGKNASLNDYCIGLLFEGVASSVIVVFIVQNYLNSKFVVD